MIGFKTVRELGLLGMNRRNAEYLLPKNERRLYPLVDDKLKTKDLLYAHQLPSPELYFVIRHNFEVKYLREIKFLKEFVIKPARGAEGRGILVIQGKTGDQWRKASGASLSMGDIEYHVSNILAGLYSLGGVTDIAFIEYCVRSHIIFRPVAFQGVPDMRVILYRGIPMMSMLRLPTRESDGKANLHQGAVGAGIDILSGVTLGGVHRNYLIDHHPDTNVPVAGLRIPFWDEILETSAKVYEVFRLGYFGIDFVIDHLLGPLILELNARPGLNIQLANREGLLPRLREIDALGPGVEDLKWERRLEISRKIAGKTRGRF